MPSGGLLGKFINGSSFQKAPASVGQGVARPVGGLPNPPKFESAYVNRKTLIATDLLNYSSYNPGNLLSTQFTEVGAYTVPVQTCIRFGYGAVGGGQEWAAGNLYWDMNTSVGSTVPGTGTDNDGIIRFFASNSQGTFKSFFIEQTTGRLRQSTPSERLKNPEQDPPIYENSRLTMEYKPNTTTTTGSGTISGTASGAEVDITQYL